MSENLMNKWDQVQSPGRNELVFANRFKEYGAYQIRSQFSKNQSLATLIALSVTALFAAMPIIVDHFFPKENETKTQLKVTNIDDVKTFLVVFVSFEFSFLRNIEFMCSNK